MVQDTAIRSTADQ